VRMNRLLSLRSLNRSKGRAFRISALVAGLAVTTSVILAGAWSFSPHVGAASKTKIVNAAAYFEATASGSTYQIPNSATMLVETPPLPAGDYLAHAAVSGQIPPSTDTSDYIDCFINTLDKNDGRYAWGYNGDMTLAPSDAFMNVRADSRLKLYCFEGESGGNAVVYYGDLSVIRYSSISTSS